MSEKAVFTAKLELISLDKFKARFRVLNPEGWAVDIHHLDVARKHFPVDYNFNMDFLAKDIDNAPVGVPGQPIDEKDVAKQRKTMKNLQNTYKQFTEYTLTIAK